ncbi:MAG: hypothetical protein NVSMB30_12320 [Hymenobacter sp.]
MLTRLRLLLGRRGRGAAGLLGLALGLGLPGCQPQQDRATAATPPPVGHYEGSLGTGPAQVRAALDIRHPSPGHYEAELTVPGVPALSFVADTVLFGNNELRLRRPARPGQALSLVLDGDFWRGSLALDSTKSPLILVKRGAPTPSAYRVEEVPQGTGSAWLFTPSDTGTPGPALALFPDAETAPTAALWADALAREGIIVLVLPVADSVTAPAETPRLQRALRLLRGTAGADTANVGAWAAGWRAAALAEAVSGAGRPRTAFLIAQNAEIDAAARTAFRELRQRKLPVLGLYSGSAAQRAGALRSALGGRRGTTVRVYRATGPDLLVPGGLSPHFGPGLPADVVEWLRGK